MEQNDQKLNRLINDIDALRSKYDAGDAKTFAAWEAEVKRCFIVKSLKDHKGIELIVKHFTGEVEEINVLLLNDEKLTAEARLRLMDKRDLRTRFLKFFTDADNNLDAIEKQINDAAEEVK